MKNHRIHSNLLSETKRETLKATVLLFLPVGANDLSAKVPSNICKLVECSFVSEYGILLNF